MLKKGEYERFPQGVSIIQYSPYTTDVKEGQFFIHNKERQIIGGRDRNGEFVQENHDKGVYTRHYEGKSITFNKYNKVIAEEIKNSQNSQEEILTETGSEESNFTFGASHDGNSSSDKTQKNDKANKDKGKGKAKSTTETSLEINEDEFNFPNDEITSSINQGESSGLSQEEKNATGDAPQKKTETVRIALSITGSSSQGAREKRPLSNDARLPLKKRFLNELNTIVRK